MIDGTPPRAGVPGVKVRAKTLRGRFCCLGCLGSVDRSVGGASSQQHRAIDRLDRRSNNQTNNCSWQLTRNTERPIIPDRIERGAMDMTLNEIVAQYRPYETMPEFWEGLENYRHGIYRSPYDSDGSAQNGVKGQAWDRGANAAMRAITAGLLP
jgi:hypothetical protein